ncbi:Uncharacterised protein [Nocardia africana]|uniref:Uncharacterized protein n=1 Tax=Nocardia africana TaxID=134964 RepID=A0A378X433_9NOCA|nr:Uncharacterised protein [Nocardia africana]
MFTWLLVVTTRIPGNAIRFDPPPIEGQDIGPTGRINSHIQQRLWTASTFATPAGMYKAVVARRIVNQPRIVLMAWQHMEPSALTATPDSPRVPHLAVPVTAVHLERSQRPPKRPENVVCGFGRQANRDPYVRQETPLRDARVSARNDDATTFFVSARRTTLARQGYRAVPACACRRRPSPLPGSERPGRGSSGHSADYQPPTLSHSVWNSTGVISSVDKCGRSEISLAEGIRPDNRVNSV